MTQASYPWGGTSVGDAIYAPYSDDEWSDLWRTMVMSGRVSQGVLFSYTYPNPFKPTNPSGTTIRVSPGYAMVDGKILISDANVDFSVVAPGAGTNYYGIFLRKSWAAQTVRLVLLGPDTGSYPTGTQTDGVTWDVPIGQVSITSGGTIAVSDSRSPVISPASGIIRIQRQVLVVDAQTVTFTDIPQYFTALRLEMVARGTDPAAPEFITVKLKFNNDTAPDTRNVNLLGDNGSASSTGASAAGGLMDMGVLTANGGLATVMDSYVIEIPEYSSEVRYKTYHTRGMAAGNGGANDLRIYEWRGWWLSANPISRVDFQAGLTASDNKFIAGSVFKLYGIM